MEARESLCLVENLAEGDGPMNWIRVSRQNYPQLLFVFGAFSIMVAASFFSIVFIMQGHIMESTKGALRIAEANIKVSMREPETNIQNASRMVRQMIDSGFSQGAIRSYFNDTTDWLLGDVDRWLLFRGLYGMVRGEFMDGTRWRPPANYFIERRPWFVAAREKRGGIAVTAPYSDNRATNVANRGKMIISMSREFYGTRGEYLGVIAMDMFLEQLFRSVTSLGIVEGGYGVVLNGDFQIIGHKDPKMVNKFLRDVSPEYEKVTATLASGREVSGMKVKSENGVSYIVFFRKMYMG
ncbi:MAG: cache domain-containing protein, partial [Synergistaceae bacterium]|nr:cache domain-containing protein [Synergistaceae bacterium]